MKKYLGLAILTTGFSGLVAQLLLLRELLIVFAGNELSIGIILANWLVLGAFGCFFLGKRAEKIKNKIEIFVGITILLSLSLPAAIYLTRILKNLLDIAIGEGVGLSTIFYSSFLILLPVSVAHGVLFTLSCKIYSTFFGRDASSISKVYIYGTIGTVVGGVVWTYLLIPYFHAFYMAVGLALLNFLVCLILLVSSRKVGMLPKTITAICSLLLVFCGYLLFAGGADRLHRQSIAAQWSPLNVVHYQNSIYGNITVTETEGEYTFFLDGIPHIITPIPDIVSVEEFVHLPLLSHPHPEKVLILGGGAGGMINEILRHPAVEIVDYAELDPLLIELIRKFPTPLTEKELGDSRVRVKHIDGRRFLRMTENKYDLILLGPSDPADMRTNRFFTRKFFHLAGKRLTKEGILVIGLPGSLTYLSEELRDLNACIFQTLKSVFPYVRVIPGDGRNIFLASKSEGISLMDKTLLMDRLMERDLKADLAIP